MMSQRIVTDFAEKILIERFVYHIIARYSLMFPGRSPQVKIN